MIENLWHLLDSISYACHDLGDGNDGQFHERMARIVELKHTGAFKDSDLYRVGELLQELRDHFSAHADLPKDYPR